MNNLKISKEIKSLVKQYMLYTYTANDQQEEMRGFIDSISPSLKNQVKFYILSTIMRKNPYLRPHIDHLPNI